MEPELTWWAAPLRTRALTGAVVAAAAVVGAVAAAHASAAGWLAAAGLTAVGLANGELGRRAEGGVLAKDRPHKALSAWPFAVALLATPGIGALVAAILYAHARARGLRIRAWKWVYSWGCVSLASTAAGLVFRALAHGSLDSAADGPDGLLATGAAGAANLLALTALLFAVSRVNLASDEVGLRARLADPAYYTTEAAVLCCGVAAAVLWTSWPGFLAFLLPVCGFIQRAVLTAPLQQEARLDAKTGLLNVAAWREQAARELERARRAGSPVALLVADLDGFKRINDEHGHLLGDEVLVGAARALQATLRRADLAGRFGGDELCALLPDTDAVAALAAAERALASVRALRFCDPGLRVTVSLGVAACLPAADDDLDALLTRADRALYRAKAAGRDRAALTDGVYESVAS